MATGKEEGVSLVWQQVISRENGPQKIIEEASQIYAKYDGKND